MEPKSQFQQLSRRERQIMDAVFRLGEATAAQIQEMMPEPPSNSTVRMLLRILVEKEQLIHRKDGRRFIYRPAVSPERAQATAVNHLVKTFFAGSTVRAVAGLLGHTQEGLTEEEIQELSQLIEQAKGEGR
ncbi:MAG: BlaI/MecI/CopY family transcriptional regulator [Acidobacteriota bacterium]|nr:BlaI/MecI/CopY family transcriptional regulator [Acidobacteriota bacterium]